MSRYSLIFVGMISITAQVMLLREISVLLNGIELLYILSFSLWLIGSTIGVTIGKKSYFPEYKKIRFVVLFLSMVLMVDFFFLRGYRVITNNVSGSYIDFYEQVIIILLSVMPIGILIGILYQWVSKDYLATGKSLVIAYGYECFGSVIGGLISTLAIVWNFQNSHLFIFSILLTLSQVFFLSRNKHNVKTTILAYVLLFLLVISISPIFNKFVSGWNHPHSVLETDTPFGRVNFDRYHSQLSIYNNDAVIYNSESIIPEEFIQISSLFDSNKENCLLLSECGFDIAKELSRVYNSVITQVESNKELIENFHSLADDTDTINNQYTIVGGDGRQFLRTDKNYSAIYVKYGVPVSLLTNRYYTKEFFSECAEHLRKQGVLALSIDIPENILTNVRGEQIKSIYSTMSTVFTHILVLRGMSTIFIASNETITMEFSLLESRLEVFEKNNKFVGKSYLKYLLGNDRTVEIQELTKKNSGLINSDSHPICFQFGNVNWLAKFFPSIINIDSFIHSFNIKWNLYITSMTLLIILFLYFRRFRYFPLYILAFSAGLTGTILEAILIIYYQTLYGSIYQDIGILLTVFMIGLTLGVILYNHFLSGIAKMKNSFTGFIILTSNITFLLIFILVLNGFILDKCLVLLLVLISSILSSLLFSYSAYKIGTGNYLMVQNMLGADLLGGFTGYFLASLFLIPFFGFQQTTILLILFTGSLLILLKK